MDHQNYRTARLFVTMILVVTAAAVSIAASYQSPGKEKYTALKIPTEIHAPAGEHFSFSARAIGVQIYVCKAVPQEPSKFEWKFVAPEADLFDSEGRLIGRHFLDQVNAGPAWELNNGSKVVADTTRLKKHNVETSIPWLFLPKKATAGDGALSSVKSIQRLFTVGGKAPTEAPDKSQEGKELRVYYSATYYFNN